MIADLMRRLFAWFNARVAAMPLKIVAARPLHGGAAIYVADIDGRRLVFAAAANALCLLAAYPFKPSRRSYAAKRGIFKRAPKRSNGMSERGLAP